MAYDKVDNTTMKLMILGDDKIRKDSDLVDTFSLSTALNEKLEPEVRELITRKEKERGNDVKFAAEYDPNKDKAPNLAPNFALPVADAGAILATRGWSPMLNDAFIMGGIHHNWDFFLGLAKADKEKFQPFLIGRSPKDAWQQYLKANPLNFWDEKWKVPRVFVRELIGLKTFGYKPEFNEFQLGFACGDTGKADGASLYKYLDALSAHSFHEPKRDPLLATVGEFLFGDPKALLA